MNQEIILKIEEDITRGGKIKNVNDFDSNSMKTDLPTNFFINPSGTLYKLAPTY